MLSFLGLAALLVALFGSILLTTRGISAARSERAQDEPQGEPKGEPQGEPKGEPEGEPLVDLKGPVWMLFSGAVVAMAAMQIGLLTDDFSLAYLANHHSSATPFPYDVATAYIIGPPRPCQPRLPNRAGAGRGGTPAPAPIGLLAGVRHLHSTQ